MTKQRDILEDYLSDLPARGTVDLDQLKQSAKDLESDPEFQADLLKGLFVNSLLETMESKEINKAELAKKLGKTRQYISKILNEDHDINFTLETMVELSMVLELRFDFRLLKPGESLRVEAYRESESMVMLSIPGRKPRNDASYESSDEEPKKPSDLQEAA